MFLKLLLNFLVKCEASVLYRTLIHLILENEQIRDQSLSRLKSKIELMYLTNGNKKVVVLPHSMGVIYFLHFLKWVESPPPMGGGGEPGWCAKHIKSIMNIGPPFLGVPKTVSNILSSEGRDIAFIRLVCILSLIMLAL